MMDAPSRKKIISILNILHDSGKHLGSTKIAQKLQDTGVELSQRTVRHYLSKTDKDGLTQGFGKKGRIITPKGEEELKSSFVINKVGFVASKIDNLTYQMDFSLRKQCGKIILNISTIERRELQKIIPQLQQVFRAGLGMGRYAALISPGEKIGKKIIAESKLVSALSAASPLTGFFFTREFM